MLISLICIGKCEVQVVNICNYMVVRRFAAVSCDYEIACSCEDEEASALCRISDLIDRDDFECLTCILVIFIDME